MKHYPAAQCGVNLAHEAKSYGEMAKRRPVETRKCKLGVENQWHRKWQWLWRRRHHCGCRRGINLVASASKMKAAMAGGEAKAAWKLGLFLNSKIEGGGGAKHRQSSKWRQKKKLFLIGLFDTINGGRNVHSA